MSSRSYYNITNLEDDVVRTPTGVDMNSALIRRTEEIKARYKGAEGIGKLLEKTELLSSALSCFLWCQCLGRHSTQL